VEIVPGKRALMTSPVGVFGGGMMVTGE